MKQNFALTLSLIGGLMLLASACVKEKTDDEKLRPVGSEIIFSAATSYENDDRTRTVYTGKDENGQDVSTSSSIERIDWENDDRVSIVYVPGSPSQAEYKVTNVLTSTDENDEADVVPSGSSKLVWAPAGSTDIFYAMYPTANGNHANSDADLVFSNNTANVQGVIPSSQPVDLSRTQSVPVPGSPNQTYNRYLPDMKYAYMVGYADGSCIDGSRVTIPFTPAVTAFNFIFKAASAVTVTGFEMTTAGSGSVGTTLAGDFNFYITGAKRRPQNDPSGTIVGADWNSNNVNRTGPANDNGKTITVSFSQDITLSANQYLDFTVFTLPIMQKGITIKFHLKNVTNGVTTNYDKTLELKDKTTGNWHEFAAGKKHVVTNDQLAGDNVTWVFEVTPTLAFNYQGEDNPDASQAVQQYSVTSYKQIGSSSSNRYPVAWEATEYKEGNGSWVPTPPSWLKVFTHSDTPSAVTSSYNASLAATPRICTTNSNRTLGTKTAKGTAQNPYDLSTNGGTESQVTANCYVVDAPGWYCFPMTYGNGKYAFDNSSNEYFLQNFKDHLEQNIDNAWVSNRTGFAVNSADLVWQDSESLISNIGFYNYTAGSKANGYIKFYVSPATIKPGNAVIAVKSGNNIAWSWHIWVTDHSMNPVTVRGSQFMEVNLGWCDTETYNNSSRTVQVRLRQNESGETKVITLNQQGLSTPVSNYQTSPHYQWGRKDPIVPPAGIGSDSGVNKKWYDKNGTDSQSIPISANATNLGTAIQNPMTFYYTSSHLDWTNYSKSYCNLWNSYQAKNMYTDDVFGNPPAVNHVSPDTHGKTAYDPCPRGYIVPHAKDFIGFSSNSRFNNYTVQSKFYPDPQYSHGWTIFAQAVSSTNTYLTSADSFWPALGQRVRSTTSVLNFDVYCYFVTATAYDNVNSDRGAILIQFCDNSVAFVGSSPTNGVYMTQSAKAFGRSVRCVKE